MDAVPIVPPLFQGTKNTTLHELQTGDRSRATDRTSAPRCNLIGDLLAFEAALEGRPTLGRSPAHEVTDPSEPCAELRKAGTGRYVLKALDKSDLDLVMRTGRVATYQNREYLLREGAPAD